MPISQVNNQIEIGMTKDQFLAIAKKRANKDAMTETYYVYRIDEYGFDASGTVDSMFYYFRSSDDTLFEVNAGTTASDINVNINN
tara:strand:- start:1006 stop:1260 length:255 start_codon:yes stop_codon:yes gene_type:complete